MAAATRPSKGMPVLRIWPAVPADSPSRGPSCSWRVKPPPSAATFRSPPAPPRNSPNGAARRQARRLPFGHGAPHRYSRRGLFAYRVGRARARGGMAAEAEAAITAIEALSTGPSRQHDALKALVRAEIASPVPVTMSPFVRRKPRCDRSLRRSLTGNAGPRPRRAKPRRRCHPFVRAHRGPTRQSVVTPTTRLRVTPRSTRCIGSAAQRRGRRSGRCGAVPEAIRYRLVRRAFAADAGRRDEAAVASALVRRGIPTPATYIIDSLTPSRPSARSIAVSATAAVVNGARPSHVATRQNVCAR